MYKNKRSCIGHSQIFLINKNKRAQFFLLAAVIISLVLISLGATTNKIVTQEGNFQEVDDFSYQVQRETGEVLNYEIYSGISGGKVEEFARIMAQEIQDKDPETEFVFVFGNVDDLTISNYGTEDLTYTTQNTEADVIYCRYDSFGFLEDSNDIDLRCVDETSCYVCAETIDCPISDDNAETSSMCGTFESLGGVDTEDYYINDGGITSHNNIPGEPVDVTLEDIDSGFVTITIDGVDVVIPVSEYRQAQLIVKRDSGDEVYFDY